MKKTLFALLSLLLCAAMLLSFAACEKNSNKDNEDEDEEETSETSGNTIDEAIQDALDGEMFYQKDKLMIAIPADAQAFIEEQSGESFETFAEQYCEGVSIPDGAKIDWEIVEQAAATEDELTEVKNELSEYGMSEDKLGDVQVLDLKVTLTANGESADRNLDTILIKYDGTYYVFNCIQDIVSRAN